MSLFASPVERRAENYANGNHNASRRKPLMLIISAAVASVAIGTVILAGAAILQYQPTRQHVEVELKCDGEPCKLSAR
jgi:hypothetical protein